MSRFSPFSVVVQGLLHIRQDAVRWVQSTALQNWGQVNTKKRLFKGFYLLVDEPAKLWHFQHEVYLRFSPV
jgi:hypothetical protein